MQIKVCSKSTDYKNLKNYLAAILKFETYAFFRTSKFLKQNIIFIQVYTIKLILP